MNETIKTEIQKTKTNKNLLTLQVKRTHTGCKLFLKSDVIEGFFSKNGLSDGLRTSSNIHDMYKNQTGMSDRDLYRKLNSLDDSLLNSDGYTNAVFLRAKGLSQGVTFDIRGLYSKEALKSYVESMKELTKTMYNEYMKPTTNNIKMTIEETD